MSNTQGHIQNNKTYKCTQSTHNASMRALLLFIGVAFHLSYLWSIFDIYFVSPLVHGMDHVLSTEEPPAKRLFLIVGDGQRADKTFGKVLHPTTGKFEYLSPFIRNVVEKEGTYGISHTRMPTESRPGHVAMIAGFYEDVSAVTKGWKTNPVDFDSFFNQSRHTYSFGSPDILPMFAEGASDDSRIDTWMYGHEYEDFTQSSIELDTFVFKNLHKLFENASLDTQLDSQIRQEGNVFFLHLLGTDTAGHAYRPYSAEYYDNIKHTDSQIEKLVPKIHEFFGDDETAFIFTADHGMSDFGSHGDGHPDNTRTPLVAWGAGINKPQPAKDPYAEPGTEDWQFDKIQRFDVNQADIASLMSYLVGTNYPANSVGELPLGFLSTPEHSKLQALYQNALSILEQYLVKEREVADSQFRFKEFPGFVENPIDDYKREIIEMMALVEAGATSEHEAIAAVEKFISACLEGLDYLQSYNLLLLRSVVCLGFLGWICYSFTIFLQLFILEKPPQIFSDNMFPLTFFGGFTLALSYMLFYQKSPFNYYVYAAFPLFLWYKITRMSPVLVTGVPQLFLGLSKISVFGILSAIIAVYELIVYGFFDRRIFSLIFVTLAFYPAKSHLLLWDKLKWSILSCGLAVFNFLDPVKKESLWQINLAGVLILFVALSQLRKVLQLSVVPGKVLSIICLQLLAILVALYSTNKAVVSLQRREGLPWDAQFLGWLNVVLSLVVFPLAHYFHPSHYYRVRYLVVFLTLAPTFLILTISFESLFYVIFAQLLLEWTDIESSLLRDELHHHHLRLATAKRLQLIRVAMIGFFFMQVAFFGTGNVSSISSFSLDSVYRLLPIFDPFPMGALLMVKLVIPYLLLSTCLGIMTHKVEIAPFSISTLIISTSDILSLNFFFLVKTEGSWLDIGITISNYCLAILSSLFMLILEVFSSQLLKGVQVIDEETTARVDRQLEMHLADSQEIEKMSHVIDDRPISHRVRQHKKHL